MNEAGTEVPASKKCLPRYLVEVQSPLTNLNGRLLAIWRKTS
jgi:hypothetical protein